MNDIELVYNDDCGAEADVSFLNEEAVRTVRSVLKSFGGYAVTPLVSLPHLSKQLGVGAIYLKDESKRFGLNAFKALGGAYAICRYIAKKFQIDLANAKAEDLSAKAVGRLTFVTATDGNHGRGVAYAAAKLGHKAVVYMPKGSSEIRLRNILREGAEASITELNYDDAVRLAYRNAQENDWVMVQDTAWEGYTDIPLWIMQGYGVIADEIFEQLDESVTHVFLQVGVGSFAGAITACLKNKYRDAMPRVMLLEPHNAACLFLSLKNRELSFVGGEMQTIMAGLACGEPNIIGYQVLKANVTAAASCADRISAEGMRILAAPLAGDPPVVSGESGAVGIGALYNMMTNEQYEEIRTKLQLNRESKVLVISTEGDTDPERYRRIVWEGVNGI